MRKQKLALEEKLSASRKRIILYAYKNFFLRVQKNRPFLSDFKEQMDTYSQIVSLSYLYSHKEMVSATKQ